MLLPVLLATLPKEIPTSLSGELAPDARLMTISGSDTIALRVVSKIWVTSVVPHPDVLEFAERNKARQIGG